MPAPLRHRAEPGELPATRRRVAEPSADPGAVGRRLRRERAKRRAAQLRPSRLQGAPLADAADWLEQYRRFWEGSFDSLDARLRSEQTPEHG